MVQYALESRDLYSVMSEKVFEKNKKIAAVVGGLTMYISQIMRENEKNKK